jgi:hypothetical protein
MAEHQYPARPWGDIYVTGTSAADTISQRLYAEQKQRDADQRKALGDLDNEFAKNVAGVRDADIPELTQRYADYKTAAKDQIKRGNLTPTEQLEVLRKKANVYDIISKSKAQKEKEQLEAKQIATKPISYTKDAHNGMIGILNTPVTKLGDADPFDAIRYKGNMSDFNTLLATANGKPLALTDEVVDNPQLRRKDVTKVTRLNNPIEYFDAIRTGLVGNQKADDFVRTFGNISPEEMQATEIKYNQLMQDPTMVKRLGMEGKQLPPTEGLTDAERAAKYLAMQHTLSPLVVTTKEGSPIYDRVALEKDKNAENDRRAARQQRYAIDRMNYRKALGLDFQDISQDVSWDDTGMDKEVQVFVNGKGMSKGLGGQVSKGVVIDQDGKPILDGTIRMKKEDLPSTVNAVLRGQKIILPSDFNAIIKNGKIEGIETPTGVVTRNDLRNYQLQADKERKGENLHYTSKPESKTKTTVKSTSESGSSSKASKWGSYKVKSN